MSSIVLFWFSLFGLALLSGFFTLLDFNYIHQLSEILTDSGEPAFHGELGNITIEIFETMNTYEHKLITLWQKKY